jgi:V8-like Glu-specific endopeptidase
LRNLLINNSGYPADKPFGTQWFNAGRISRVTDRKLFYMVDTYGGQSGSAIWRFRNGQRHAVGIHGYGGCPNSAVRIIRPVFDNMLAWKRLGL